MPSKAEDILEGFKVNWMNLRDGETGKILWQVSNVHGSFVDGDGGGRKAGVNLAWSVESVQWNAGP